MTEGVNAADIADTGFDQIIEGAPRRQYFGLPRRVDAPPVNIFTGRVHKKPRHHEPKAYLSREEKHRIKLIKMLESNLNFIGRSYSYKVLGSEGCGEFSVYGVLVLTLNLIEGTISALRIPTEDQVPAGQYKKQMNLTRLLFRRLGLNAVRNKDFTVVETNGYIKVLEPGETWVLPTLASPLVLPSKVKKEWTQLPLISDELYHQAEKKHKDEKHKEKLKRIDPLFSIPAAWATTATNTISSSPRYYYTGTDTGTAGTGSINIWRTSTF